MIRRLSSEVRDQIAAGEVVERPAHLVKELIENSLDAGANQIQIRVSQGGRCLHVVDNGKGIPKDQLELALERFATSKIEVTEDIWKLKTFGFRGEALASAAAISQLRLTSRPVQQASAFQIQSDFGKQSQIVSTSLDFGTEVFIKDLFENVPARLKFLKSEIAENLAVRNVIKSFALAHPLVEFKYFENDRLQFLFASSDNWQNRCQQVFDTSAKLYHTQIENEGWRAEIVFADPQTVSKTPKQMWFFVQDRWVQDRSLQASVIDAYRSLLMHGEYPIAVVKLNLPPDEVDVNIHPTKSQVKFLNPSQAFRTVHHALKKALDIAPWLENTFKKSELTPMSHGSTPLSGIETQISWANTQKEFDRIQFKKRESIDSLTAAVITPTSAVSSNGVWSRLDVIGQIGLTYIVAQDEQGLLLVDQHAAHERVAFERLIQAYSRGGMATQEFLFPLVLDLSPLQIETLKSITSELEKFGLRLEALGPSTISLSAAPLFMKESSLPALLAKTADEIYEMGDSFQFDKKLIDICATFACHSVVRAGQSLSLTEMRSLLEQMDEYPHSSFCPHGRPVSVRWSFIELEKEFGRRN